MAKYTLLLIALVFGSSSAFDVPNFLKHCRQEENNTLHCSNFRMTVTDDNDIQTQNFIISNASWFTFSNCSAKRVNENFLSKFPEATFIRFVNCSMNFTSSVRSVGPKTHPLNRLVVENSQIFDDRRTNALQSAVDLDKIAFKSTILESRKIDGNLLQNNKKLTSVVFEKCNIGDIYSEAFINLALLEHLNLNGNALYNISSDLLKNNKKIKQLTLKRNRLSYIPADIILSSSLEELSCPENYITALSQYQLAGLKNLKLLDLRSNYIDALSDKAFGDLSKLVSLDISYNRISNLTKAHFQNLKSLEYLNLAYNKLLVKLPNNLFDSLPKLKTLVPVSPY